MKIIKRIKISNLILLVGLLTLLKPVQSRSQTSLGIIGGMNLQSLVGDAPDNASYGKKAGFMIGLNLERHITDGVSIVFQPNYSHTGTSIDIDIGAEDPVDSFNVGINFYRLPVFMKVDAFNGVTYFISGIDVGILKDAEIQDSKKVNDKKDITEIFNKIDVAAQFGVGVKFKVSQFTLGLEGRYSQSLLNLSNENSGELFDNLPSRFRQSGFQFLSTFSFKL